MCHLNDKYMKLKGPYYKICLLSTFEQGRTWQNFSFCSQNGLGNSLWRKDHGQIKM